MVTLIGTPPNIIIATFRAQMESVEPFRMFDFAYVGGLVAFTGVIYIILIGWRILPKREKGADTDDIMKISEYLTEVIIPENSKIKGEPISELKIGEGEDITFVALIRNGKNYPAPDSYTVLQEGDILVIEASTEDLQSFIESNKLKMAENVENVILDSRDVEIIEAVVQPGAYIEGKTSANLYFWNHYPVNLLGVAREGERLKTRLKNIRFRSGDVLLLQGKEDALYEILPRLGGLPLAERELKLDKPQRILEAFLIFLTAIIIAAIGILPVQISFLGAAIIMILANFISLEEAYRSIDWPVIILLGAMFPLSEALESTGGTDIIANYILNIAERVEIWMALGVVFVGTMILSNIINNAAAAVLMAPIALNIAEGLNMSPDPFLMGVAISASSAFLTPIGHQSNTLVMGPGGYKFSDYWKMGLPLAVIVILTAIPLLLFFW